MDKKRLLWDPSGSSHRVAWHQRKNVALAALKSKVGGVSQGIVHEKRPFRGLGATWIAFCGDSTLMNLMESTLMMLGKGDSLPWSSTQL